ncbi:hypothetical protein CN514_19135 [Bacillus sp. AFS001701]|uniref:MFS transporter n=1 Tax=Bacillus sp. AFS001701 TaxID=2033480 RepID=UPI000BF41D2D|nr:MFS transporter [Bacillus sp. AFS001701]PET52316.1 hypothetical protein CN514_19135 [Bacillus sp. AFS001701]
MNYRILALGTFATGMEGFTIAGLLPELAQNLNFSVSVAGHLVTVFHCLCSWFTVKDENV